MILVNTVPISKPLAPNLQNLYNRRVSIIRGATNNEDDNGQPLPKSWQIEILLRQKRPSQ